MAVVSVIALGNGRRVVCGTRFAEADCDGRDWEDDGGVLAHVWWKSGWNGRSVWGTDGMGGGGEFGDCC